MSNHNLLSDSPGLVKMWTDGVYIEDSAKDQLRKLSGETAAVECRKDKDVIDETPLAYKDLDSVMAAQSDLVDVVHTLRAMVCVKG